MKKVLALILVLCLAISLVACAGNTSSTATTATTGTDKTYTVGVIQLMQHAALDAATKGFEDALKEKMGDSVKIEVQNASGESANCTTIANGFVAANVDLIMANATPAVQAAGAATGTIPILGTSVTDYASALDISDWAGKTGTNISGTSDLAPLDGQAEMIKELFPDAKNIGLLYCSAEANSQYQVDVITEILEGMGYTCTPYAFVDSNDVSSVAQSAAAGSDVIYIPTDNTAASNTEAINNVCLPAGVPIVAGEEGICGGCGVATLAISYYDLGYATGLMAYEILVNGKDVKTMDIEFAPNFTKKYNPTNCEALNVTVPADYEALG